jgi:hypothetical protein
MGWAKPYRAVRQDGVPHCLEDLGNWELRRANFSRRSAYSCGLTIQQLTARFRFVDSAYVAEIRRLDSRE